MDNLDKEFKKVESINYKGEITDDIIDGKSEEIIILSNNALLNTSTTYSETASVLPKQLKINNCLMWTKQITGVDLQCGMLNLPTYCKEISEEEFATFKNLYKNNSPDLVNFIDNLQKRLLTKYGGYIKRYKRKCTRKRRKTSGTRKHHIRKTLKH